MKHFSAILLGITSAIAMTACVPQEDLVAVDAKQDFAEVSATAVKADKETATLMVKSYDAAINECNKKLHRDENDLRKTKVVDLKTTESIKLQDEVADLKNTIVLLDERKALYQARLAEL